MCFTLERSSKSWFGAYLDQREVQSTDSNIGSHSLWMGSASCATTMKRARATTVMCWESKSPTVSLTQTRYSRTFGVTLKNGKYEMKTVTLQVAKREEVKRRARDAFEGKRQGARISFATPELLFRLLTAKRWEMIRALAGAGPVTIREVARRLNRDVKAVHGDVHALLNAGVIQKTADGCIVFPFDVIRVNVMLRAA
jgi:predicted transcriptional regulator